MVRAPSDDEEASKFSEEIGSGSYCIVAVCPAKTENIAVIDKLLKKVHQRRTIFISTSSRVRSSRPQDITIHKPLSKNCAWPLQETRRLKNKLVKMPSLVLEKVRKPSRPQIGDDFLVHAICFNCWIGMNRKIDLWKAGNGFFTDTTNYFGKRAPLYGVL